MFLKFNVFTIGWAMVILILTLLPSSAQSNMGVSFLDKIIHAVLFAVLTFMAIVGFKKQYTYTFLRFNALKGALLFANGYGILIEFMQVFIPLRSFDLIDMLSNFTGTLIGLILFLGIYKF